MFRSVHASVCAAAMYAANKWSVSGKMREKYFYNLNNNGGNSGYFSRGHELDDRDSIPGRGERIFPLASLSRAALEPTQPPAQWVQGGGGSFPGAKVRPEHDTGNSPL
jgi:hypothetical protein